MKRRRGMSEEIMNKALEEDYPKPILIKNLGLLYATENSRERKRFGMYECGFCGTEFKANTYGINSGNIKSCGCYKKRRTSEANKKHGLWSTRLYKIWGGD
jgi:hypothetical protein